ncbi:MAG: tRNA (guanosine(46)-N7)-methyltransferase TrmB [Culicoidibacterales bacterium]
MRLRNIPHAKETIENNPQYVIPEPKDHRGSWQQNFEKNQPLHIEVGMGRGRFLYEMAQANPTINYLGIEKMDSVIIIALERLMKNPLPNLRLIRVDAEQIDEMFARGEVERVYLNFSDPWPKKKHAKRRLTHENFLKQYETITDFGAIHFKTDNRSLFEYSLMSLANYGMKYDYMSLDLHNSDFEGNIMTEYEARFSQKGHPIYRLEAHFVNKMKACQTLLSDEETC